MFDSYVKVKSDVFSEFYKKISLLFLDLPIDSVNYPLVQDGIGRIGRTSSFVSRSLTSGEEEVRPIASYSSARDRSGNPAGPGFVPGTRNWSG
jgi:hypothetical protein